MWNCYTSIFEGSDRNSYLHPTKKGIFKSSAVHRVKMIPTFRGTEQSSPISAQSRPETRILLERSPQTALREGRAAWNTNPTDFIAHDLFRSGLSVPRADSLLHRVQLQLHKNERIFIMNTTTVCSHQSSGRNPEIKGCWMKSLTCTINILFHFIWIIKKYYMFTLMMH